MTHFSQKLRTHLTIVASMAIIMIGVFSPKEAQAANCPMDCVGHLNVTLNQSCNAVISHDMLIPNSWDPTWCYPTGPSAFMIIVTTTQGDTVAIGSSANAIVPASYINQTLNVWIKHWYTGNSCTSTVTILDSKAPWMTCPADITVSCGTNVNPSTNPLIGSPTIMDCSSYTVNYYDQVQDFGCNNSVKKIITRIYTATDYYNNSNTCSQKITMLRPSVSSITFPANYDGISNPILACSSTVNTTPSFTGVPLSNGQPLVTGGDCALEYSYTDQITNFCANSYMIVRTWTVVEWCSGSSRTGTQIIKVLDQQAPTITCPAPIIANSTSSTGCGGSVTIPPAQVSDNCSSSVSVTVQGPNGLSLPSNGGTFSSFPSGVNIIRYTATDACGNTASCTTTVTFQDNLAPNVVCHQNLTATLTGNGTVIVYAQTLNAGSFDACCGTQLTYSVKRMDQPDSAFGPSVTFTCADIGSVINLILRVTDCNGVSNTCMVQMTILDKTDPVITCPANVTINCGQDANTRFTTPTVTDGCSFTLDSTTVTNINMCGSGYVRRVWTATDHSGNSATCSQTVFVQHLSNFTVQFPVDFTTNNCDQDVSPSNTGQLVIGNADCEMIAQSYTDETFWVVPEACYKVFRTWKVINWCTYNINNPTNTVSGIPLGNNTFQDDGDGFIQHIQVIKVLDNVPPVMQCPSNITVSTDANCKATVNIPHPTATDACSQNVIITSSSTLGSGYGPFNNVAIGTYPVTFTANDGCGNVTTCTMTIVVKDTKKPTPYCQSGIVTTLMPVDNNGDGVSDNGMIQVWASDFNLNSYDNCTASSNLRYSFSSDVNNTSITYTCNNVNLNGPNFVELWVTDEAGNQDFCITYIIIQDNMGVCPSSPEPVASATVSGRIQNEMGQDIQNVNVSVNSSNTTNTTLNGNYTFPNLATGSNYVIRPIKNNDLLNGVSTIDLVLLKKHILGIELLNSPYKLIAADVNNSKNITTIDLVELRKAILGLTTGFINNTSWRFIDKNYTFVDPSNPLLESFPEQYTISNLNAPMNINFLGIKIGDLNNTATTNLGGESTSGNRSEESMPIHVTDIALTAGQTYRIPLTVDEYKDLLGFQMELSYDKDMISIEKIETGMEGFDASNYYADGRGQLNISFAADRALSTFAHSDLITLVVSAKGNTNLSDALRFSESRLLPQAYFGDENITTSKLNIDWTNKDGSFISDATFRILSNTPNPFSHSTVIKFNNSNSSLSHIEFFAANGELLHSRNVNCTKGINEITVNTNDLLGYKGIISYRITNSEGALVGKILRIE